MCAQIHPSSLPSARAIIASVLILFVAPSAFGQPALKHVMPGAVMPGVPVDFVIEGDNLQNSLVWTPLVGNISQATIENDGTQARVTITADPACPVGVTGMVLVNQQGISDPLLLMVDDIASTAEDDSNRSRATAQPLQLPAAVDGRCQSGGIDYFSFHAAAGERVGFEVVAQRMGSLMDPVAQLFDPAGIELLLADDDGGLGADCRGEIICQQAGEYSIELRDNQFRGGGHYRLRIGDFPVFAVPLPTGGRLGSTACFRFAGAAPSEVLPMIFDIPSFVPTGTLGIAVKSLHGDCSGMSLIAATNLPEHLEVEPNDEREEASQVTLPCAVSGTLQRSQDQDHYAFAVSKGTDINFLSFGRRFGSPAIVFMTLFDPTEQIVAQTTITDGEETTLSHTAKSDGVYRLAARDLNYRGGARFAYRIELRTGPDFSLRLKGGKDSRLKAQLPQGDGACRLAVAANRIGYDGPIQLEIAAPNHGFHLNENTIPSGKAEVNLWLSAPDHFQAGDFAMLRFVATGKINGRNVRRILQTEASVRAQIPGLLYAPGWYDGLVAVATIGAADRLFDISSKSDTVEIGTGRGRFEFKLQRVDADFKSSVDVYCEQLPAGVTTAVESDKDDYRIVFSAEPQRTNRRFTARLVILGELGGRGQRLARDLLIETDAADKECGQEDKNESTE